jgi:hypothetical protein
MPTDGADRQTVLKERIRGYNRKNYQRHKPARLRAVNEYRQAHPEKVKEYGARNWEKHGARYRQERKDRRAAAYAEDPKSAWYLETFRAARVRAKKNGLPFDLQPPRIDLPSVCPVLLIPIVYGRKGKQGPADNSPSLDRLVPARGYVAGNLMVISNRANMLKNNAKIEELKMVIEYMEWISAP